MTVVLWLGAACVLLPTLAIFWPARLRADLRRARDLAAPAAGVPPSDDDQDDARLVIARDGALGVLTIGALVYWLVSTAGQVLPPGSAPDWWSDYALASAVLERVCLTLGVFLIVFGLLVTLVPRVMPLGAYPRLSKVVSFGTGICIAATFALWLGSSSRPYALLFAQVTQGLLQVVADFLALLLAVVGGYLTWRRLTET